MQVSTETVIPAVGGADSINLKYDKDGLMSQAGALKLRYSAANSMLLSDTLGGVITNYSYTTLGELASKETKYGSTVLLKVEYARDSLSRITEQREINSGVSETKKYSYDIADRLWKVWKNDTLISEYSYDANGNRLSHTTPTKVDSGCYDAQDRLLTFANTSYIYSPYGDLRYKVEGSDTTRYQYDAFGALRSVTLPNGTLIEYLLDGNGLRIGKKIDGVVTQKWLYSNNLRIVAELDSANNITSRFIYTTNENVPEYMVKGGVTFRIVTDHLGSVKQVVNTQTGMVAERIEYDEFGNVLVDTNPRFVPFGFGGGLYDSETKLVRFGARDYDATTGRWTAKDPLLFGSGSSNLYSYAGNDPMNMIDYKGAAMEPVQLNLGISVNAGQAVAAATIFAAATDLIHTILAIWTEGRITPKDYGSLGLDWLAISAGSYNFAAFSQKENARKTETDPLGYLAKELGFNEGFVDLGVAITTGVAVGILAKTPTPIKPLAKSMAVTMCIYAWGRLLINLDNY